MVNILKMFVVAGLVALLTVVFDAIGLHMFFTDPQEIWQYYLVGFIGAFIITLILYQLYTINIWFVILGGILFASWKGVMYLLSKGYDVMPFRYSVVDNLWDISVFGSQNKILLFTFWAVGHSLAYIFAFLAVYYIVNMFMED